MGLTACVDCGTDVSTEAANCPKCGRPVKVLKRKLSRTAAGLLALFLGGVGVQYFYLGHPLSGVLCIVFCWTFIPAIAGLLQGIYLLTMSDANFEAKYCR